VTAIFAHRGCCGVPAPRENTLAAFDAARRSGADGVELDVRATADGALVVHHDRAVPGAGDVGRLPVAKLPREVPLLEDALAACAGVQVDVEIKGGPDEAVLVARQLVARELAARLLVSRQLAEPGAEPGALAGVLVSSFDPECLLAVRELAPEAPTGLLVGWEGDARVALDRAAALGCATVHPHVTQVDAGLVEAARERALGLCVWTVNADADLSHMGALGVEAVVTDRVDAALAILRGPRTGVGAVAKGRLAGSPARNGGEGPG
jgi:glycerophosphoryl diester phosphodiesterase